MVHITDVLAVSMMLGITAQVKEAGVAWDKGEKRSKALQGWGTVIRGHKTRPRIIACPWRLRAGWGCEWGSRHGCRRRWVF